MLYYHVIGRLVEIRVPAYLSHGCHYDNRLIDWLISVHFRGTTCCDARSWIAITPWSLHSFFWVFFLKSCVEFDQSLPRWLCQEVQRLARLSAAQLCWVLPLSSWYVVQFQRASCLARRQLRPACGRFMWVFSLFLCFQCFDFTFSRPQMLCDY